MRHDDDVVELGADHRTEQCGKEHVAHRGGFRVVAAARQLALADDLRNEKRQEYGDPEPGEVEPGDAELERMMDDRRRGERHAATSPGMG